MSIDVGQKVTGKLEYVHSNAAPHYGTRDNYADGECIRAF